MKTKYLLSSVLSFSLLVGCAYSKSFSFTPKEPQWSFYGEGTGAYVTNQGRDKEASSLWLSTDWGESETAYFTWNDLSPGNYKVITYVRAKDVQKGAEGASFWHFYDGGFGTVSPFMDLSGDYDWRKIEYTIKVKASDLTVWFRLKSPGQIWVDDFYLEKVESGSDKVSIEAPMPLPQASEKKYIAKAAAKRSLYTFDKSESGHPFDLKNKAGSFTPQKFFNFKVDKMPVKDWSAYDRIEMDVFNPNDNYTDFYLTLADNQTTNYWSQVNHKSTLAPGWNKLNFSLTQFVGERGSHRFNRPVNLSKLEKVFIVIDPDSKSTFEKKDFLIDNISLVSNPMPAIPEGVKAFDFTSHKANNNTNLTQVSTQTAYNDQRGYGFVEPKFWRVEDAQYASEMLRHTIGVLGGHFRVKLPNGKYQMNLIVDKLGYWDVPFWSDRTVYANGAPVFKETRGSASDFVSDLLRFESITPEPFDHPYDLYLSKVFHTIDKTVEVSNGILDLEFEGDATGISLNSLVLWNKNADVQGLAYKSALEKRNKQEFDWMTHSIAKNEKINPAQKFQAVIVEPDLYLNPVAVKKASGTSLLFQGGAGDTPYQLLQLTASSTNDEKISWSFSDFTNEKGEKIKGSEVAVSDLVFQYTSPDINHETYLLTGKYLRPMNDVSVVVKKGQNKYLWLQVKMSDKTPKGIFKGNVVIHKGSEQISLPTEVAVLNYTLPKIEFPVGFFGLDPLPYSYYPRGGYNEIRKKYRHMALNKLGEAGFTTFTGLPEDVSDLNDLFKESAKWGIDTVYSYGGQFPQSMIDLNKKPAGMSDDDYFAKSASDLKSLMSKKEWPKIVHTFSDEAGGYSDKIASDIELAKKLNKHFPFMPLGGFGSFHGGDSAKLNSYFTYGFYSSLSKGDISRLKDNRLRWGFYNTSAANLDDPRFSFGLGLYIARLNGLSQYLEWHANAVNNYPYYDFDGREADVVMFYPTKDGKLLSALRFELATEGLHAFKKLKVLEEAIANNSGPREALNSAKSWMDALKRENYFYSSTTFMSNKKNNFRDFESQLNGHLRNIFLKK